MDSALPFRVVSVGRLHRSASPSCSSTCDAGSARGRRSPAPSRAVPRRRLGGPAVAVSGRLLRLDGRRPGALLALERRPTAVGTLVAAGPSLTVSLLLLEPRAAVRSPGRRSRSGRCARRVGSRALRRWSRSRSALYALWWLGWGHDADSAVTARNIATAPLFLPTGSPRASRSLLGLATRATRPRSRPRLGAAAARRRAGARRLAPVAAPAASRAGRSSSPLIADARSGCSPGSTRSRLATRLVSRYQSTSARSSCC